MSKLMSQIKVPSNVVSDTALRRTCGEVSRDRSTSKLLTVRVELVHFKAVPRISCYGHFRLRPNPTLHKVF